jgi:proteasome lid subunit RPN8/RPN11
VMSGVLLQMSEALYQGVWVHLLQGASDDEQAGFAFARAETRNACLVLNVTEWKPVNSSNFAHQSEYHLELSDETRGHLIKRAHDLECSLVEFHSHPGPWPAQFSPSDFAGLAEFVPHVWWRLKKKPYAAVVVSPSGFDGLAWVQSATEPALLLGIDIGHALLRPTGLSWRAIQRGTSWIV